MTDDLTIWVTIGWIGFTVLQRTKWLITLTVWQYDGLHVIFDEGDNDGANMAFGVGFNALGCGE